MPALNAREGIPLRESAGLLGPARRYLAVILDLHCRQVVGWAVSDRMKKDLAIRALDMAVRLRQPPEGCFFHSDRGSQYCSYDY